MQRETTSLRTDIIVMGAGAAGVCAALELAARGHHVTLIEKNKIFSGASGNNPGRMGHGFHYTDVDTAFAYLRESIRLQRHYPRYLIGQDKPFNDFVRHGRYFIMKDSIHDVQDILSTYQQIQEEYTRLVAEDPLNEVFGPPETFFRMLHPDEYSTHVNASIIVAGVETAEHLFDWKAFALDRKAEILSNNSITLYEGAEVMRIQRGEIDAYRFTLEVKNKSDGSIKQFHTNYLVNSTWDQIEFLNDQIGIRMLPGARTNRLKCLLVVKLPESLQSVNSMFFCMGKHCMFSNMGNGYGMLTFANVTNIEVSSGLHLGELTQRLLHGGATDEEKSTFANEILEGVSNYIPEMINATIVDLKFGIVQSNGALSLEDLNDPRNDVHKRNYFNVQEAQQGLINNPAVKLSNCVHNGELVAELISSQIRIAPFMKDCIEHIEESLSSINLERTTDMRKTLSNYLERYTSTFTATLLLNNVALFRTMQAKSLAINEIKMSDGSRMSRTVYVKKHDSSSTIGSGYTTHYCVSEDSNCPASGPTIFRLPFKSMIYDRLSPFHESSEGQRTPTPDLRSDPVVVGNSVFSGGTETKKNLGFFSKQPSMSRVEVDHSTSECLPNCTIN